MGLIDSTEAIAAMTTIPDPRVHARHYLANPPPFAVAVEEPWWWAVLALGADCINVHFETDYRGPLAIVSHQQPRHHRDLDVAAISAILKAEGRPTFDAYSCPRADMAIVGLVDVVDCVSEPKTPTLWFVGPHALIVEKQCLLPIGAAGTMIPSMNLMLYVDDRRRESILYSLNALANGHLQPGAAPR